MAYYFSFAALPEDGGGMAGCSELPGTTLDLSQRWLAALPSEDALDAQLRRRPASRQQSASQSGTQLCQVERLQLDQNRLAMLSEHDLAPFSNLRHLDVGKNVLTELPEQITRLDKLHTLIARNNLLEGLPKDLSGLVSLRVLNLSGNCFSKFPQQLLALTRLEGLYLGSNSIRELPCDIKDMCGLEMLYLGGNQLTEVPATIGCLPNLASLVLCDNKLESIPAVISQLRNLQSLSLHNNRLTTLPRDIVQLNLLELSLRNNPLVMRFVRDMTYAVPSLLELAARTVRVRKLKYTAGEDLPKSLTAYLDSAKCCVNPKCKGVYFDSRVRQINFVDFCGKYRLPLLEYLCSPSCTTNPITGPSSSSDSEEYATADEGQAAAGNGAAPENDEEFDMSKMKRVLLG